MDVTITSDQIEDQMPDLVPASAPNTPVVTKASRDEHGKDARASTHFKKKGKRFELMPLDEHVKGEIRRR